MHKKSTIQGGKPSWLLCLTQSHDASSSRSRICLDLLRSLLIFFFFEPAFSLFFPALLTWHCLHISLFFFFLTGPDLVDPFRVAPPQLLNFPVPQFPLLPIATHRIIIWRSTFPSSTSISDLGAALSSDRPSGL